VVALASAVRRLLDQSEHRRELAERGRARAREFSWQRAADATLAVYRTVAAEA
jgi:phosphatidylinositol alpha-mannosyltransferase